MLVIFLIATLSTPDDTEHNYQKLLSNKVDLVFCSKLVVRATVNTVITPSSAMLLVLLTAYPAAPHVSQNTVNQTCSAMLLIQLMPAAPPPHPPMPPKATLNTAIKTCFAATGVSRGAAGGCIGG